MKTFREYLAEAKLDKTSIMNGSHISRDINFDERKGEIKIWLNGGSWYTIKLAPEIVKNMRDKFYSVDEGAKYMSKYLDKLAEDTAEFITKEVTKWEKDFK